MDIRSISFILFLHLFAFPLAMGMLNKDKCNTVVSAAVKNGSLAFPDESIFYQHSSGDADSEPPFYTLTIRGCNQMCGSSWTAYSKEKIARRLTTWFIPIIVLVGNMHLAALGLGSTMHTIVHLLGDPIDSMWSLLTKLEVSRRCRVWVAKTATRNVSTDAVAAVLAAMEELGDSRSDLDAATREIQPYLHVHVDQDVFDDACEEAAAELADSKVDESSRTYLAILGYLFTLSGAFIEAADSKSEKPGNRIAFATLFSWLIPAVLLSAATRRFCSGTSCKRIIKRFQSSLNLMNRDYDSEKVWQTRQATFSSGYSSTEKNLNAVPWAGAIYTYRPVKHIFATGSGDRHPPLLLFLAALPIILATSTAFTISYFTPTVGLGCRSLTQLSIGLLWSFSACLTWLLGKQHSVNGKYIWWIVLVKDTLIGIPAVLMVVMINVGIFNTCWCWSAVYSRGVADAFIALTTVAGREENSKSTYPVLVFGNVGLLLLLVLWMRYGEGFRLRIDGGEERKRRRRRVKDIFLTSWPGQRIHNSRFSVDQTGFRRNSRWQTLK